jgi:UDP-glucose 4-epimerase
MSRVVLVTGVARYLGGRLARMLLDAPGVDRVVGVDVVSPDSDLGDVEFVRADIRNPIIAKVIAAAEVDTVVHMNVIATPLTVGGRSSMKEINVIGTMQLLAACQRAPSVQRLVVKSSTSVYGSSAKDPALFTEDLDPRELPRSGYGKDSVEVEGYVRGFARRRPDVGVVQLRFANVLGAGIQTAFTEYFKLPVIPTVFGYDPRLQFIHEDDCLDLLQAMTLDTHVGTYNAAGDGVITLSQAIRRAGKPSLPVIAPLLSTTGGLIRRTGLVDFSPDQLRLLRYGRAVSCERLADRVGWRPAYSTLEAFDAYVAAQVAPLVPAEAITGVEERLAGLLTGGSDG